MSRLQHLDLTPEDLAEAQRIQKQSRHSEDVIYWLLNSGIEVSRLSEILDACDRGNVSPLDVVHILTP